MNYLLNYLENIAATATEESRRAFANADLIERTGKTLAKLNALAGDNKVHATYHLDSIKPCVTLQCAHQDEFISMLETAGYDLHTLQTEVFTNHYRQAEINARVTIEPGIEALLRGQRASQLAANHLTEEAMPCVA